MKRPELDPIHRLDVSDAWKRKFRLIESAGGPDLEALRDLEFRDRFSISFNLLAFVFGPIYFLAKGLWRQASLYVAIAFVLFFILELLGLGGFSQGIGYGFAAMCAGRANVSYYKKVVLQEAPWL